MKVLLTGATGYVGHQLALALANQNITVHALVRDLHSEKAPIHRNIILIKGDICDYGSIAKAIEGCEYVFHSAAFTNLKCRTIDSFYNTNVLGTENVLRASVFAGVKKVIYTSTLSVYGPSYNEVPITETQPRIASFANDYELTKSMSEELVQKYIKEGLSCIILNVTKVYGPGVATFSSGVNKLISMLARKDFLMVPDKLKSTSNYVFIDDVVKAHILAMKSHRNHGKYIIGGENVSYQQLFSLIMKLTRRNVRIVKVHFGLVKLFFSMVSLFQRVIRIAPSITPKMLDFLFVNRIATSDRAKMDLNYRATPLYVGLKETINFLKLAP
ncbi:NAD-dependent epimerase/dehydratase family protein [Hyunsoonleella sp. SJ7]|uniref:NAD-dependent epimerase/dehydratase family protein n=1 Tax=Hyunsoonleella aquatilis TaxID=2762758 RepID=A0A923KHS0_9FLAO|nr:NAD-dependent epimerase/dehydratase family protein [Hyunsoonleella aquatilis]MBC3757224.1 NAD-dependent epimerase/dehydratase family protein [Hyunsoonleella aquatilis]